jgi:hypothetical protein
LLDATGTVLAMPKRSSKPRDLAPLAKVIVDESTGEERVPDPDAGKNPPRSS